MLTHGVGFPFATLGFFTLSVARKIIAFILFTLALDSLSAIWGEI
jgi:hypothetical protein